MIYARKTSLLIALAGLVLARRFPALVLSTTSVVLPESAVMPVVSWWANVEIRFVLQRVVVVAAMEEMEEMAAMEGTRVVMEAMAVTEWWVHCRGTKLGPSMAKILPLTHDARCTLFSITAGRDGSALSILGWKVV